jgi:hypothetical protein
VAYKLVNSMPRERREFADTDDLYVLGLDSLTATELVMMLETGLSKDHENGDISWLLSYTIYGAPRVVKLAAAIYMAINPGIS